MPTEPGQLIRAQERARRAREAAAASKTGPSTKAGDVLRAGARKARSDRLKSEKAKPAKKQLSPPKASPQPSTVSAGAVFYALLSREAEQRGRDSASRSAAKTWKAVADAHPAIREAFVAEERAGVPWRRHLDCRAESKLPAAEACADYVTTGLSLDAARRRIGERCPNISEHHRAATEPIARF